MRKTIFLVRDFRMSNYQEGYLCRCCGSNHAKLPMSYGSPVPDYYYNIPLEEHESRIEMNEDLCIIDEEYFLSVDVLRFLY